MQGDSRRVPTYQNFPGGRSFTDLLDVFPPHLVFRRRMMVSSEDRYEYSSWADHLRKAETLWKMDNRADHNDWALVYTELEQLFNLNPGDEAGQKLFKLWYKSTIAREISLSSLPPMHVAAPLGLCGWAEHLLKKRQADPNESVELFHIVFEGPMAFYPLLVAKNMPMLRLLLENKADINVGKESALPIFLSLMFQDSSLESLRLMLHHGADPTVSSFHGFDAFHLFAAVGDDPEALQLLLDHSPPDHKLGINAAATDESVQNFTPLHILFARKDGNTPINLLRAFVEFGADVNAEDSQSMRPLQKASASGDLEVLKPLCENHKISEIDDGGSGGRTALHTAAGNNHADCVQFLLSLGANATIADANGSTALHVATSESQVDAVV
ncbi:hypothetical protein PFICI_11475 [Pestalotiopsis fici W106-1]|uniref:Uncharacterized protein n=1 Tax=Pestalotiopsis fici (strain W106-1 / CGMCC3.15140) TaxID=1229662 RepID=W3WQG0_PESFW|nr:uncharacterized protein PFICI_11475 [Pestalotiopsis fici W106-1]ETS76088.1 hypothetical protein PFICI_11475 [Pestalotiopsis fici W106-1]